VAYVRAKPSSLRGVNDRPSSSPSDAPPTTQQASALPGLIPRVLAVLSIILGGLVGGLVGWALADIECTGDCANWKGAGLLIGAIVTAAGVAVVTILTLRAMDEWETIKGQEQR